MMKVLNAAQLKEADLVTINQEPISSLALMERAAKKCFEWILINCRQSSHFVIICGTGNNGGDGLAIARMMKEKHVSSEVVILKSGNSASSDFSSNLEAARLSGVSVMELKEGAMPDLKKNIVIVDAIFGTGLNKPLTGWMASCVQFINESGNEIISIDMPSGLFCDKPAEGAIVHANFTLTFHCPKLAFFFAENEKYCGQFIVLDIGLSKTFLDKIDVSVNYTEGIDIKKLLKPRRRFSHKGLFGKGLLIAGSTGKMGAAILAARSCLRSGIGLLTVHIPEGANTIVQTAVPEAMTQFDFRNERNADSGSLQNFDAVAIGPGIGLSKETAEMFYHIISNAKKPLVIDADGLNILSENREWLKSIPANSVLTPHPKEFERLAGKSANGFESHSRQLEFSAKYNVIVVLKGANTSISTPSGKTFFNSTGNPGMAKAGNGDALTGITLSFLAQGYSPEDAAKISVYIHGLAGDYAAIEKGYYSMICSDLIERIPEAFRSLE